MLAANSFVDPCRSRTVYHILYLHNSTSNSHVDIYFTAADYAHNLLDMPEIGKSRL